MDFGDLNDSVLDAFGQSVTISGTAVDAIFTQPVVGLQFGASDTRRPAPELLVRTTDLASISATPRDPVVVDSVNYIIVSHEPDDGGMTRLILRKGT